MKRVYEYVCKVHGKFDAFDKQETRYMPKPCPDCGKESGYAVSSPRSALEGLSGDFPTAHDRWATRHEKGAKQRSHWLGE
jgi:hypothetical protein